ncbi:MAG: hypothetical protein EOP00_03225 [Pedobacter sp.]|nr:MAG: hypothetical protein EOP00_03225 [Pedobacter sp.]
MENENNNRSNGAAQLSEGASVPKGRSNGEHNEVKEGDPNQQRPVYGSDGGPNTSTRQDQLPSLNDGAKSGGDSDSENGDEPAGDEQMGSDADQDRGRKPSI